MNISFDLRRDIRSKCAACQITFSRKKDKANEKGMFGRSVKAKGVK